VGWNDLPKKSELRRDVGYRSILEGQFQPKVKDEEYEISCLMGAFYWMKKDFYHKIHGFDTIEGIGFRGHRYWSCLEPHLSLKVKAYGGKCILYPYIEAGHIFGRLDDIYAVRAVREDMKWWNRFWVAHTLLDGELKERVLNFPNTELNVSLGRSYVRKNWDTIQEVRERNSKEGKLISE
jgi:hypothetical protein